jgi:inner membrane protein
MVPDPFPQVQSKPTFPTVGGSSPFPLCLVPSSWSSARSMDPITHTALGATLAGSGLRRTTALATPTLLVAVNLPDVDILTALHGPYAGLALRRGITHGLPALVVLPLVLTGIVLAWDRWIRRRRDPEATPAQGSVVLGLSVLGVATHPVLDWLNTYGMRWLLPFDGGWSYGDAIFIVDPWLWLLLAGPAFLVWSRGRGARLLWAVLAILLTLPVLLAEAVPAWARGLWIVGLLAWTSLRAARPRAGEPAARISLFLALLYTAAMVGQTQAAREMVRTAALEQGAEEVEAVMAGPVPVDPFRSQVVVQTPSEYWTGRLHWFDEPRVRLDGPSYRRNGWEHPAAAAALDRPQVRDYLTWTRFPRVQVLEEDRGWRVRVTDVRYPDRGTGALGGVEVFVPFEDRSGVE